MVYINRHCQNYPPPKDGFGGAKCVCEKCIKERQQAAGEGSKAQLTYLAVPYSSPLPAVREARFQLANKTAGRLMSEGHVVFSPISHSHPIAQICDLPQGWDFWEKHDRTFLAIAERLVVLMLPGWEESIGIKAEIKIAEELGIPVEYITE